MKKLICIIAAIVVQMCGYVLAQWAVPGEGKFTFSGYEPFADRPVDVYYYLPPINEGIKDVPVIFVFEGADRGADRLFGFWKEEARREGFILLIPHFDVKAFPLGDYQETGVLTANRKGLQDPSRLTSVLIDKIFEYVKEEIPSAAPKYVLYGHSAGGQFIQRFMLFHHSPYLHKAVFGSPGWYTFPDKNQSFPYGTKGIDYVNDKTLRRYLSTDVILQLGMADTVRESYLRKTPEAEAQGANRLERGRTFYAYLQELAARKGWPMNWRKMEVPGVGHNSIEMGRRAVPFLLGKQPEEITSFFYPETTNRYNTPTLGQGGKTLATVDEIYGWLRNAVGPHTGIAAFETLGTTPGGHEINLLRLGTGNPENVRVWIQACLHGNEPAGTEAVCILTDYLLNTTEGRKILEDTEIAIVPLANPDGYAAGSRRSGGGLDLNRDQSKLADPVSRILKQAFSGWSAHVALDIHEFRPSRKEYDSYFGREVSVYEDVLFLPTGHPNVPVALRDYSVDVLQQQAVDALKEHGYNSNYYFSPKVEGGKLTLSKGARSPQSSSTAIALSNAISMFIEIRGIGLGIESFGRRSEIGFIIARSMLETCSRNKDDIRRIVSDAIAETIDRKRGITVTSTSESTERRVTFVDFLRTDTFSVSLPTLNALRSFPELVRKRPLAYALSDTCARAAENLRLLGAEVEKIASPMTADVEEFTITEYNKSNERWEGIYPVQVRTTTSRLTKTFPVGTYLVYLNQKTGNHMVTLLEPESANGFVGFGVIEAKKKQTLPIYRIMH